MLSQHWVSCYPLCMSKKPRKTPEERIAELEENQRQIKARIQREKARVKEAQRKQDTRRKIIIGGMVMAHCQVDPAFGENIMRLLNQHVTRAADREAIGLAPLDTQQGNE